MSQIEVPTTMQQRILIAEDDEVQAAVLVAAMRRYGYMVDMVGDGLEAIRNLRTGDYDLALIDYNMPQVNGRAVAQLLQDLPAGINRPRLIAVTAAAERLQECEIANGSSSFDAVVSKNAGFPALFEVIKQNLMAAAESNTASLRARERDHNYQADALRRRRRQAPLFALPGLAMAACFAAALWWAGSSLSGIAASIGSAHSTIALSTDAQILVGAVADTQASQRNYLVTGSAADRAAYDAGQEHLDRLLSAATPLNSAGTPGFAEGASPTPVIQSLLRTLGQEAELRSTLPSQTADLSTSSQSGQTAAQQLRDWAGSLVAESQDIVVTGLEVVRQNMMFVMIILTLGFLYGLSNAAVAVWRQFQVTGPRISLLPMGLSNSASPMTINDVPFQHRLRS